MKKEWIGLWLGLFICGLETVSGQATYPAEYKHLYDLQIERIGSSSRIFNGKEYANEDYLVGNHPFLDRKAYQTASVRYGGFRYDGLSVMYDVYRQVLVLGVNDDKGGFSPVEMIMDRVDAFSIGNRQFVRLKVESEGYFEVLVEGPLQLVSSRSKKQRPASGGYSFEFYPVSQYFLKVDDKYHTIRTKNDFYNLFKEDKKTLKQFARRYEYNTMGLEDFVVSMLTTDLFK